MKKMVASLKEEMKLTKSVQVKRADVEKLASRFLEEYRSSVDESGITAGLLKMFHYIWNNPDKNGETAAMRPAKTQSPQKKKRPIPAVRGGDWAHLPLKALKKDRPGRAVLLPCKILAQDVQVSGGP